ncbi:MAG TPA: hypothetical protein VGE45_21435 [Chloroflexia bacterium]
MATSTPNSGIFFPQQVPAQEDRAVPASYLTGKLAEVNGCLRVIADNSSAAYLILWPPDVTLSTEDNKIQIYNKAGQVVAQVGDSVFIDGGEIPASSGAAMSKQLREPLPDACPGPYWFAGDEVRTNQ